MTSLDVAAPATSSPAPQPTFDRQILWSGGIVTLTIPPRDRCREGEYEGITFVQFVRHLKGGLFNIFVHGEEPTRFCGLNITGYAELIKKTMPDGRSYIHLDIKPTDLLATHRFAVVQGDVNDEGLRKAGLTLGKHQIFKTPEPLVGAGAFVISPVDRPQAASGKKARAASKTGDVQLDRYLEHGWVIAREDATTIHLRKGDRTLSHPKPKKTAHKHNGHSHRGRR